MTTPRPARYSIPMSLDNFLKILIAVMISLLGVMGNNLMQSVEKLETKMEKVEAAVIELKKDVQYLTPKRTAMTNPAALSPDGDVPQNLP